MTAYYNEIDQYAAQWLRNLIEAGHIAPGYVDERSIEDVYPSDLKGFTQCHFFAGIGVWSLALRKAGWTDDRPVWTGSCPCQPFSAAGAGAGFADPRHLWPTFAWLIKQCSPPIIFGEQVASKAVEPWVDLVHADMEALGYAFGAVPFPSAGVGAPHIRDRLFWVADSEGDRYKRCGEFSEPTGRDGSSHLRSIGWMEHARFDNDASKVEATNSGKQEADRSTDIPSRSGIPPCGVAYASSAGSSKQFGGQIESEGSTSPGLSSDTGPVNGFWRNADWIGCRDDKWRPVEPSTFPLANGASSRMGRLRAYGNAINAEAATAFIECVM